MAEKGNEKKVEVPETTEVRLMNKEESLEMIAEQLEKIVNLLEERNKILEGIRKDNMYKLK